MSESQSRYSIVERLTNRKLQIMQEKLEAETILKQKFQKISELEKDLQDWENDVKISIDIDRRKKQKAVEQAKIDYDNDKDRMDDFKTMCDEKIKTVDGALQSIEEISKTAPNINK